jgi:hypothetical protein
MEEDLVPYTCL